MPLGAPVVVSLEQHLLALTREVEALKNALAVCRAACEYVVEESTEPVMVENARVALELTREAAEGEA